MQCQKVCHFSSLLGKAIVYSMPLSFRESLTRWQLQWLNADWTLQGVARVLSKLPSLQSMTQRLRTQSHKGMQPVAQQLRLPGTVAEAEEERRLALPVCASEAHVVVFVHGFRVCLSYCWLFHVLHAHQCTVQQCCVLHTEVMPFVWNISCGETFIVPTNVHQPLKTYVKSICATLRLPADEQLHSSCLTVC